MTGRGNAAFIAGGGQGIGKANLQRLLRERLSVVIATWNEEAGQETEAAMRLVGGAKLIVAEAADQRRGAASR